MFLLLRLLKNSVYSKKSFSGLRLSELISIIFSYGIAPLPLQIMLTILFFVSWLSLNQFFEK